uniref:NADH-ubiquinone oxidoreductase chain 4 n=2 Tax=Decemunciger sp. AB-2017 TaxID=1980157 RepID=A0A220QMG4_9ANNE|nr:NADH dehydrogenase subunit 4 [Decemunciger sp. AB-2017]ASK06212.1 NADH dehydrogenase subunit 4 [Decemunciger sp. AB-2017]
MLKFICPIMALLLLPVIFCLYSWVSTANYLFLSSILSISLIPFSNMILSNIKTLFIDSISNPLIILTLWVTALMILASFRTYINKDAPMYFILSVVFLCLSLILCFMSSNLMLFYLMFEMSLIPTMVLIIMWGFQPERLQAATYFIIYTLTASLPLLMSIIAVLKINMHLSLIISNWSTPLPNYLISIWWFVSILAFLVKLPLYSVHLWLPKAHVEAPVAGSMILAAILLKLGTYGLMRLSTLYPNANLTITPMISSKAMIGACICSFICLRQPDMKSMIAYSSIAHMSALIIGLLSSTVWGWSGAMGLMIAHGICSSAMFAIANMIYEMTNSRSLILTKGLMTLAPPMALWWFLICTANMSGPPSFNLFSEILLLAPMMKISIFFSLCAISTQIFLLSYFFTMMCFLVGAYSLFLFTATQHGTVNNFLNPINYVSYRNYLILLLHSWPMFLILLSPYSFFWSI